MMKPQILALFLAVSLVFSSFGHLYGGDLSTHPVLKHYVGKWTAEGQLTGENNNLVSVSETWEGKVDGENSFLIEGSRTVNGDTQTFKWVMTHNAATDTFEVSLVSQDGNSIRFEGQASEVNLSLDLKAVTGNGNGSISIQDTFKDGNTDTLESKVLFTGDQGQTTLEGVITHKRQK